MIPTASYGPLGKLVSGVPGGPLLRGRITKLVLSFFFFDDFAVACSCSIIRSTGDPDRAEDLELRDEGEYSRRAESADEDDDAEVLSPKLGLCADRSSSKPSPR